MPQLQQKMAVEKTTQQGKYYLVSLHESCDCATVIAQAFVAPFQVSILGAKFPRVFVPHPDFQESLAQFPRISRRPCP